MAREIMYVGKKPLIHDRPNDVPDRVWRGLGDVCLVTDSEAIKLTIPAYADIWKDVTKLSEDERTDIVEKLREKHRAEARAVTPAGEVARALGTLSTEELEKELRRRRTTDGKADSNPLPAAQVHGNSQRSATESDEASERPSKTEDVVADIAGAIVALDRENRAHFDGEGNPVFDVIVEKLGYKISKSELAAAVELIRGK